MIYSKTNFSKDQFYKMLLASVCLHLLIFLFYILIHNFSNQKDTPKLVTSSGRKTQLGITITQISTSSQSNSSKVTGTHEASSGQDANDNSSDVISKHTQLIIQGIVYPRQARMRGWQGRVGIQININLDGLATNFKLLQSSGHSVLDQAAMRGLRKYRFPKGQTASKAEFYLRFKLK